ncbi:hypothetical protein EI94DRAFT_1671647 [Lactarius quietus]|nr:hypothetical protein EI94DRAFT_1671647 [Lactarius quietus]
MLHVLPAEVTLDVLAHLPIPALLSLRLLSCQWRDFFATHLSSIFHGAALHHKYIPPGTLLLEDALSANTGPPLAGSTNWEDLCRRSIQLRRNWEGKGRAVARVLLPHIPNVRHIRVDEKAEICITTYFQGSLTVTHLFSGTVLWRLPSWYGPGRVYFEYENGYLVCDDNDGAKEVWRLASDFVPVSEFAAEAPPSDRQVAVSAQVAELYRHYAPRGQFQPWALLRSPESVYAYRLRYPTLIFANHEHAFLYDVRTGALVQTINFHLRALYSVDVTERHAFLCDLYVVHVYLLESGVEVLRIPADATPRYSQCAEGPSHVPGDWFITPLSVSLEVNESTFKGFTDVHVSRDGRDLVVLSPNHHVLLITDFESIYRGETTFKQAALVLGIQPQAVCYYLGFEHGRVCMATFEGLYIFTLGPNLLVKVTFVRPSHNNPSARPHPACCMQLTDRRIYFTWEYSRRRQDIPLCEDPENAQSPPPPATPIRDRDLEGLKTMWQWTWQHGGYSLSKLVSLNAVTHTLWLFCGYVSDI